MGAGTISEMKNLECITLFVEDFAASKKFYLEIFDLKIVYEDPVSAVFKLENVMINLLKISEAPGLIVPAKVPTAARGSGSCSQCGCRT